MIVYVLWLFLTVPWNGLQCVIVVFPGLTHLRIEMQIFSLPWMMENIRLLMWLLGDIKKVMFCIMQAKNLNFLYLHFIISI